MDALCRQQDLDSMALPFVTFHNGSGSCMFSKHVPLASHQFCKPNCPFDKFFKNFGWRRLFLLVKGKPCGAKGVILQILPNEIVSFRELEVTWLPLWRTLAQCQSWGQPFNQPCPWLLSDHLGDFRCELEVNCRYCLPESWCQPKPLETSVGQSSSLSFALS